MPVTEVSEPTIEQLKRLQLNAGIPDLPTPLTFDLRRAVGGEGPRAYDWSDKPHRLLYDACREIERLTALVNDIQKASD
jgi:hypothetical protein